MLYILPPPSAPSPPSPWTTIMCAGGSGGGGDNYKGSTTKVKTVVRSASWVTVNNNNSKRPPPVDRSHLLKNRSKSRDSGAGGVILDDEAARNSRSLSECYFAGKGAALVLPPNERLRPSRRVSATGSDIQQHLQSMFYLLRPEETLKMAVKLESVHSGRTRYLVVVSCLGRQDAEESCLLGIDCNEKTTVGLVLRVLADTAITLDGDGGFSVSVCGRQHIFKPVSVQAMWSALQTLHKVSSKAREQNYFLGGLTHDWVNYYEQRIESDRSCLNEWHAMDSIESRRPPSPDSVRTKPLEREETERVIRCTLKEIMMSVDLDEVTSKYIRGRLEEDLDVDLVEFKPFIDQEMLTILGQMDAATEIFDHVYLGSEWNASNLEELQKHGVRHILNVTREIDNFFPGMFNYLNVRVYDDEKTDLLKHWDNTFKYITQARKEGSKVLVHCKMGVSRSASVVIAYAMKAYNWDFKKAFEHVKQKRSCIKPNTSFISQLETYQGILDAMKNREKLQRSKSETNLKSPGLVAKAEQRNGPSAEMRADLDSCERLLGVDWALHVSMCGQDLSRLGGRPKSWSPDNAVSSVLLLGNNLAAPTSMSLEQLNIDKQDIVLTKIDASPLPDQPSSSPSQQLPLPSVVESRNYNLNVRMPCGNGQAYSVSQNKVVYLPASCDKQTQEPEENVIPSVKHRVIELESQNSAAISGRKNLGDRKGLVLNLTTQFEAPCCKPDSPGVVETDSCPMLTADDEMSSQTRAPQMLTAVLVKKEIWDPGEKESPTTCEVTIPTSVINSDCPVWTPQMSETQVPNLDNLEEKTFISHIKLTTSDNVDKVPLQTVIGTSVNRTLVRKEGDPFSAQLDRVFDREERKQKVDPILPPPVVLPCVTEVPNEVTGRECPSRQSSWSSYDSAVVLGYQGEPRDAPSRQSSWGSADTRCTLPSRNSSWGSYDMRHPMQYVNERGEKPQLIEDFGSSSSGMFSYDRDEIPWYPGTVKRTKQKLEEGNATVKRVCPDTQPTDIVVNNCPSPHRAGDVTVNVKILGPRPYQSPTIIPARGFTFPSALIKNPCLMTDKTAALPFDTLNPTLSHYASSPTLSSHQEPVTIKKMASSQPNITFNSTLSTDNNRAILNESDFTSPLPDCSKSLSVSAPSPSALDPIGSTTKLTQPSSSLPAMTVVGASSPFFIKTTQCASVKQQKRVSDNLSVVIKHCSSIDNSTDVTKDNSSLLSRSPENDGQKSISGLVRNLKKEFEAKSLKADKTIVGESVANDNEKKGEKVKSLPSSPVGTLPEDKSSVPNSPASCTTAEDLSVKMLVGKYEVSKCPDRSGSQSGGRTRLTSENGINVEQKSLLPQRKSSLDIAAMRNNAQPQPVIKNSLLVHNLKNGSSTLNKRTIKVTSGDEFRLPPVPPVVRSLVPTPSVVAASVVAKAASKKQQQGKTHPLARLTIKQRHNNPVYNTM